MGTVLESSTKMTSFKVHSSSFFSSFSLVVMCFFPRFTDVEGRVVSEHVELAGDGGGGIESDERACSDLFTSARLGPGNTFISHTRNK